LPRDFEVGTMAMDERSRYRMPQRIAEVTDEETAVTLMAHLPPGGWTDVATQADIERLERSVAALREDVREWLSSSGRAMCDGLADVRTEIHDDLADVRTDMHDGLAEVRAEMRDGLADVRAEMRGGLAEARAERQRLELRINRQFRAYVAITISAVFSSVLATAGVVIAATS
jgi:ElaB/YqjD/DUF883 family membrane-anchored ribosome-binding protein